MKWPWSRPIVLAQSQALRRLDETVDRLEEAVEELRQTIADAKRIRP